MSKKLYKAICEYETVMNNIMMVYGEDEKDALEEAKKSFYKWNDEWMKKYGGNEKKLLSITIEDI